MVNGELIGQGLLGDIVFVIGHELYVVDDMD